MGRHKRLAVAFLFFAASALPELLWAGAHELRHHAHETEAAAHDEAWTALAAVLVHGHEHAEGAPDHEHLLAPAPTVRHDPPRDLPAPAAFAAAQAADPGGSPLSTAPAPPRSCRGSGSSPPRLHLLCTLLI